MARESAATKADRLLVEGRLVVRHVDRRNVVGAVRGEGHIYRTAWQYGSWTCNCPVRSGACSHLIALRRITAVDLPQAGT